jgi:hypothetical protein
MMLINLLVNPMCVEFQLLLKWNWVHKPTKQSPPTHTHTYMLMAREQCWMWEWGCCRDSRNYHSVQTYIFSRCKVSLWKMLAAYNLTGCCTVAHSDCPQLMRPAHERKSTEYNYSVIHCNYHANWFVTHITGSEPCCLQCILSITHILSSF